jgi:Sugar (and other) transporter
MNTAPARFTTTQWLICIIAAIGFLFDTYELLMTPLVAVPAIAELLGLPPNNPLVTEWTGRLLWYSALCGGTFGLLGGWLIDRFGRKRIMAASIFLYAFSPFAAAFSTSLGMFVFFRCATFVGVCVEFVAAITWLAELFPDKRRKGLVLGWTQAFASLGGLLVTGVNVWIVANAATLPEVAGGHASWRYLLMTGILPAIPIALLLPFVPESQVWREKRAQGALKRPSFGALFSPELRRTTLVAAALSACGYGAAFGALQLTPLRVAPGLPELKETQAKLQPLVAEAKKLNGDLNTLLNLERAEPRPTFPELVAEVPGLADVIAQRAKNRVAFRAATTAGDTAKTAALAESFKALTAKLDELTAAKPATKTAVMDREKILKALGDNRAAQDPFNQAVKERGNTSQLYQEFGGLTGRILLAVLLLTAIPRGRMLRLFILPGAVVLPLVYTSFFTTGGAMFDWGIFIVGLCVVAQFSYFGEYLPKVFPMHLRGTGGSFATNVGGRMIGTSAAFLTTNIVAYWFDAAPKFQHIALAAATVGTTVFVLGFILSFLLPQPKTEE